MTERTSVESNQELLDELQEQLLHKKDQEHYPLAASLFHYLTATYRDRDQRKQELESALEQAYQCSVRAMTSAEQLWEGPLATALVLVFGAERGEELLDLLRRRMDYTYSLSTYYRKGYRAAHVSHYWDALLSTIADYYNNIAYPYTLHDYLTKHDKVLPQDAIMGNRIAREIDNGNREVVEQLKEILFGENQTALLDRTMIRGIVRSHSVECYDMLAKLLVAAKLQEGLRQQIVESLDEGTLEAEIYLIKVILEHNLERFSSVIRALDTWTGLAFTDQKPAIIRKCMELALRSLTDDDFRLEAEASPDALIFYFSIWAAATRDIEQAKAAIRRALQSGARYKKLTALYFLAQLNERDAQHQLASEHLISAAEDLEQVAWLMNSLYTEYRVLYNNSREDGTRVLDLSNTPISADAALRRAQFAALLQALKQFKGESLHFPKSVFPWAAASLSTSELFRCMMTIAAYDHDPAMIDDLIASRDRMDSDIRSGFLHNFIGSPEGGARREYLLSALSDKSISNRETALKLLSKLELTDEELEKVITLLKLKTGAIRQIALQLLMKQSEARLTHAAEVLFSASNEQQRLAGLAIAESLQQDEEHPALREASLTWVKKLQERGRFTSQEQILIEKLLDKKDNRFGRENGFGLYPPDEQLKIPAQFDHPEVAEEQLSQESQLQEQSYVGQMIDWEPEALLAVYRHFEALIEEHRDYEYEARYYGNYSEKVLLGNQRYSLPPMKQAADTEASLDQDKLDSYPLPEVWRQAAKELELTPVRMLQCLFVASEPFRILDSEEKWFTDLYPDLLDSKHQELEKQLDDVKHTRLTNQLLRLLLAEEDAGQTFTICISIYRSLRARLTAEQCVMERYREEEARYYRRQDLCPALESHILNQWLEKAKAAITTDEQFEAYFYTAFASYKLMQANTDAGLTVEILARAHDLGLLSDALLLQEMFVGHLADNFIRTLTDARWSKQIVEKYPKVKPLINQAVNRIVEIESKRGDLPTEVSELARVIQRFEGMHFFTGILFGLGKETFQRGYSYGSNHTKKEVLSSLLQCCYPAQGEGAALLAELLAESDLTEMRLLEAAMYAPQWVDIVQEHLGWPGLRSAAWYFHAHINESFSAQKETEVALYSPISPQSFNDGAFDGEWFKSAYAAMGEERFTMLYNCAKYITDGGNSHRRAQLFADAVLGKLDKQVLAQEIRAARNKDKLLSYPLLPITPHDKNEALERYEFIQQFLKESKQFGAQRRESEGKVCAIALENLARNSGYEDVNRMTWDLEAEKIGQISDCFTPQDINGVSLWLAVDEEGQVELKVEKAGKLLKSVPSAINKHEQVLLLKETQKSLKDQYVRAKKSFEQAMENGTTFTASELTAITRNPVVAPLVHHLVWLCNGAIGYLHRTEETETATQNFSLRQPDGTLISVASEAVLKLAHPVDLYASGCWSEFQRDLFERRIKQPFKQVFREYYRLNADEAEAGIVSRRYAGHQVQPQRTVALLRTRLWTVDYEQGLQKVYYKENLVARMYAMADWFTPADIEPPTLETVQFFNRETMEPVKLDQVPAVIFSEVMRDIDLVVSVAHAGGVDPEASHSTVEMRGAIASELLQLLKVDNVRIEGSHAHIVGELGEYTVHLGSGIVHKKGTGALNILPVHSQSRGRIFLPFADSDPRTAEIMSKLLLLAEDKKIKDPSILAMF